MLIRFWDILKEIINVTLFHNGKLRKVHNQMNLKKIIYVYFRLIPNFNSGRGKKKKKKKQKKNKKIMIQLVNKKIH